MEPPVVSKLVTKLFPGAILSEHQKQPVQPEKNSRNSEDQEALKELKKKVQDLEAENSKLKNNLSRLERERVEVSKKELQLKSQRVLTYSEIFLARKWLINTLPRLHLRNSRKRSWLKYSNKRKKRSRH
jgi:predicted RNase H-like nuclease (RuvC/YqgF family)